MIIAQIFKFSAMLKKLFADIILSCIYKCTVWFMIFFLVQSLGLTPTVANNITLFVTTLNKLFMKLIAEMQ